MISAFTQILLNLVIWDYLLMVQAGYVKYGSYKYQDNQIYWLVWIDFILDYVVYEYPKLGISNKNSIYEYDIF